VPHIARPTSPDTTSSQEEAIEQLEAQNKALADEVEQLTAALKTAALEKSSLLTKNEHLEEEMKRMQKRIQEKLNENGSKTARGRLSLSSRGQRQNVPEASPATNKGPNGEAKKPRVPSLSLRSERNTASRQPKTTPNSGRPNSASLTGRTLQRPSSAVIPTRDRTASKSTPVGSNLTAATASSRARMTPRPAATEGKLLDGSQKKTESTDSAQSSAEGVSKLRLKAPGSGIPGPGSSIPTATPRTTKKATHVGSGLKPPGSWSAASVRKRDMKE